MPYIKSDEKILAFGEPDTAGKLSYVITMAYQYYLRKQKFSYSALAMVAGVLILTLFEYVRRIVNPYEDRKKDANGDVFYVGQGQPVFPEPEPCPYQGYGAAGHHHWDDRFRCIFCGKDKE